MAATTASSGTTSKTPIRICAVRLKGTVSGAGRDRGVVVDGEVGVTGAACSVNATGFSFMWCMDGSRVVPDGREEQPTPP